MKKIFVSLLILSISHYNISFANEELNGHDVPDISPIISPTETPQSDLPENSPPIVPQQNSAQNTSSETTANENTLPTPPLQENDQQTLLDQSVQSIETSNRPTAQADTAPITLLPEIRINEVLADPDSGNEFIELYNPSDEVVMLSGWRLCDLSTYDASAQKCNATHKNTYTFPIDTQILPHAFITLHYKTELKFILNNTNEEIFVENAFAHTIDHYIYKTSHKGRTWNYAKPAWYEENPTPGATNALNPLTKDYLPLTLNEIFPHPAQDQDLNEFVEIYNPFSETLSVKDWTIRDSSQSGSFVFSPSTFSPCTTDPDTCLNIPSRSFLAVYRRDFSFALNDSGTETISLIAPNGKILSTITYDGSKENLSFNRSDSWYWSKPTPQNENMPDKRSLSYSHIAINEILPNPLGDEINEYIELYNPQDHSIDLEEWILRDASASGSYVFPAGSTIAAHGFLTVYRKNFVFALNNSNETITLITPNEKVTDTVHYGTAKENVSYNFDQTSQKWRWSKHLTPQGDNIFNNLPHITHTTINKIGYKNTWTRFFAKAQDADKEKLKVRWDFGDGSKSYLWTTRHKYKKSGIYYGSLRIQDGSEEIVTPFMITIKKFPQYDIRITEIMPNPTGSDTGLEYLTLINKSKKKIDLNGWSIATGSKEDALVNHPIAQKTILKKNIPFKITKENSAISLPNAAGFIELRSPDGSVIDSTSYFTDEKSIPDDAIYSLSPDNMWSWLIPHNFEKNALTQSIMEIAAANENSQIAQSIIQNDLYTMIHTDQQDISTLSISQNVHSFPQKILTWSNMHLAQYITLFFTTHTTTHDDSSQFPLYIAANKHRPCTAPHTQIFQPNNLFNLCPK